MTFNISWVALFNLPLILQPTRITSHSNTLIDNTFSNVIDPDIIPGNLTAKISDHLPQFAIIPNMFGNILCNKYLWKELVQIWSRKVYSILFFCWLWGFVENWWNIDNSSKIYLDKITMLPDTYAPFKRINKYIQTEILSLNLG